MKRSPCRALVLLLCAVALMAGCVATRPPSDIERRKIIDSVTAFEARRGTLDLASLHLEAARIRVNKSGLAATLDYQRPVREDARPVTQRAQLRRKDGVWEVSSVVTPF